jgi:hypothetical protein
MCLVVQVSYNEMQQGRKQSQHLPSTWQDVTVNRVVQGKSGRIVVESFKMSSTSYHFCGILLLRSSPGLGSSSIQNKVCYDW